MMAYQATGIMPEELENEPELNPLVRHVWGWFCELNQARNAGGMAVSPIGYQDIKAWSEITGTKIMPWEVTALRRTDAAFLHSINLAKG